MINLADKINEMLHRDINPCYKAEAIAGYAHEAVNQGDDDAIVVKACMNLAADVMETATSMESCHYILEKAMQQVGKHYLLGRDQQGDPNAHESVRTPEQPAWSGDGLPPVGAVVEVAINSGMFDYAKEVVIVGHDKVLGRAVYRDMDWSDLEYDSALADDFRPIRTDEEKAVGEMYDLAGKAYCKWEEDTGEPSLIRAIEQVCKDLYAAGYRKTEGV